MSDGPYAGGDVVGCDFKGGLVYRRKGPVVGVAETPLQLGPVVPGGLRHPVPEGVAKVVRPQGFEVTFALEERDQLVLDSDQPGQVPGVRLSHEVDLSREPFEPAGEGRLGFQQLDEPYVA